MLLVHEKKRWKPWLQWIFSSSDTILHIYLISRLCVLLLWLYPKFLFVRHYLKDSIWFLQFGRSCMETVCQYVVRTFPNSAYIVFCRIPWYNPTSTVYLIGTLCKLSLQSFQHSLHSDINVKSVYGEFTWYFSVSIWDDLAQLKYLVNSTVQDPRPSIYLVSCNLTTLLPSPFFPMCPSPLSPSLK